METGCVSSNVSRIPAQACARRSGRWWATLVLASVGSPLVLGDVAVTREDEWKSAIVLSFLRYAEWPGGAAPDIPITVGVRGRPNLVLALRRALESRPVNNRTIRVTQLTALFDPQCCQAVYLATGTATEIQQALARTRPLRILTIGETKRFLEFGGAVNLMPVDGHIAFEVNLGALKQSGVSISSKLLRYGQVRERPPV